ncbi:GGDEF domain-containing protein [Oricola thermophila]|uniref:diguanylate cyclase n=1 Tax=Oricola thermophila TaxID=2742145 RepID=A0A6N1VFE8_9HYPH|nr:GGDEF domain-containing protein [Oricola thermophila]QKV19680.1 GGDEF domain-containing protein [Oricola thermophila]
MIDGGAYSRWFSGLDPWQQSVLVTIVAVLCADILTLVFYSLFFADRLVLDLVLTAVITFAVAFPISWLFMGQSTRVARLVEELREASQTDHLTRLANRREFMASVGTLISASKCPHGAGTLLFIDADHFKKINDTCGHGVGDRVLVALGAVIRDSLRSADVAARMGGEEFAVFLNGTDTAAAQVVAERIRTRVHPIAESMDLAQVGVTVSIGIARHRNGQDLDDVLRAADRSLYVAKERGRDRVVRDIDMFPAA